MSLVNKSVRIIVTLFSAMCALASFGKVVELHGEYTYYDDGRHSKNECMRLAAENARIDALAKEFGTSISQNIMQTDRISGHAEFNDFLALSSTEVKGEWLGDISEPEYEFAYDKDQNLIVKCKIKGKAREISNEAVEFEALVLRNGTRKSDADNRFRHGDEMYLLFSAPCDGYVRIYLEDESRTIYELLPYPSDKMNKVLTRAGKDYVFFSEKLGKGEFGTEEELILTAPDNLEYNKVFVIFSPNEYSSPVMSSSDSLRSCRNIDFSKWLLKARSVDPKMNVKTMTLEILPPI